MRAYEFITEGRVGSLLPDVARALPATYVLPQLKNQDPYLQYRFGVAMAAAKGRKQLEQDGTPAFAEQSAWGENQIVVSSDPDIAEWIDTALHQLGLSEKILISTPTSEEAVDVDTVSPVQAFKGYAK